MIELSIIIPFLNEEENIPGLVSALNVFFSEIKEIKTEVVFVNDGSTDDSLTLLKQQQHKSYSCKVVSLSKNFGSHAALRAGIVNASGNYISFIYADLQDPLNLLPQLYSKCKEGNEIVWAARNTTENGVLTKLISKVYSTLMRKYATANYPGEGGTDTLMFSKKIQQNLNANIEANSSIFLQIMTLGYKQVTIKYDKQSRKKGKSKWTLSKKIKLFIDSFVAFSYAPIRFVTIVGILLFIMGCVFSAYLITRKLVYNDLVSGWPILISILMLGFGITNISLGVLAEYLWRTLDASRKRPVFIIDEVVDL